MAVTTKECPLVLVEIEILVEQKAKVREVPAFTVADDVPGVGVEVHQSRRSEESDRSAEPVEGGADATLVRR